MKSLSLEVAFPRLLCDIEELKKEVKEQGVLPNVSLEDKLVASELQRWYGLYLAKKGRFDEAFLILEKHVKTISDPTDSLIHRALIWQLKMAKFIADSNYDEAFGAAESALRIMAEATGKRSDDFLALLAVILYDLALINNKIGANDNAEKDLLKAQKLFEKLAKRDNNRFAAALVNSVEASTTIFKSRMKQVNILAHYQVATATHLEGIAHGVKEAGRRLVDSLQNQGDMLMEMGNYRESVKYYTKALRYQKTLSKQLANRELRISINLGKALINMVNRRSTGEQLLTSLVPLAERLGADNELKEISYLLKNKPKLFDVMGIIKKFF